MFKLNIGCGNKTFKDCINIDIQKLNGVNIIASAELLPFKFNSFSKIYAFDIIEHVQRNNVEDVLIEWHSVLDKKGELIIKTPNLREIAKLYIGGHMNGNETCRRLFGNQSSDFDYHKCVFDLLTMQSLLDKIGFKNIRIKEVSNDSQTNMTIRCMK